MFALLPYRKKDDIMSTYEYMFYFIFLDINNITYQHFIRAILCMGFLFTNTTFLYIQLTGKSQWSNIILLYDVKNFFLSF